MWHIVLSIVAADNGTKGLEPTQPGGECWGFDGVSGHGDGEYEGEEDVDENGDEIIFDEAALRAIIAVILYWLCIELYKGRTVKKRFAI